MMPPTASTPAISGQKVILLVEDNPDDVALTQRALRKNRIYSEIVVARDAESAIEYLFEPGPKRQPAPELILLDLRLPKLDGFEVLRRVREDPRTRFVPVVILTTSAEDDDLARGYELGANSYVVKPVDFARFVEVARELGLYWLLINSTPRTPPCSPTGR